MQNNKMGVFFVRANGTNMGSIILAEDRNDARKFYSKHKGCTVKYFDTRCMKLFDAEFGPEFASDSPKVLKDHVGMV